jgi:multidrug resistance efflux pump
VWSRFHDGGSLSSVSRVEAKELTERVAHLERDRAVLVQELQAAQQVRADWESALSAAEAKVLHERSEHASAVALLRNQLAGARAELEAVRGELAQVRHLCDLKSCCALLAPAPGL